MKWTFKDYVIYEEKDVLRFEDCLGRLLGYVSNDHNQYDLTEDLEQGAQPIEEGWEDGIGNTLTLEGWNIF